MSEAEAAHDEEAQTESTDAEADTEEVYDEEPTGADPNGEVDVATGETETVEADPEPISLTITGKRAQELADRASTIVEECKFRFTDDGLNIRAVDPANVAMIDLFLDATGGFESYSGTGVLGVDLSRFEDIVGMADADDLIFIEYDEETRKLDISFDGLNYTLALIDPDSIRQEPDIPALDLPAEVVVEASQLKRGIKAADMVSDHIALSFDPTTEMFHIEAEGDTDDIDLELCEADLIDYTIGEANSLFSLDYLKDLFKPYSKGADDEITLELGDEFPVKAHAQFASGAGSQTIMLAPRIQSD